MVPKWFCSSRDTESTSTTNHSSGIPVIVKAIDAKESEAIRAEIEAIN